MQNTPDYFDRYSTLHLSRSPSGVLTLQFHTNGGAAAFSGPMQIEFPQALYEIGEDRNNRVLILTGTGDRFMTDIDRTSLGDLTKPAVWDEIFSRGRITMQRLVDLEMPIITAANGPASIHSEWVMMGDIAIVSDTTVFSDYSHPKFGTVPGDGVALIWEEVLGLNRARHLTLTGGSFTAQEAKEWGVVAEVVPLDQVLPRAQAIAESLSKKPQMLTRFMSVTLRQRLSRRVAEGVQLGMALEGLAASDKAYQSTH
ncbi:enoyl-CoA hydratase/isomerase family protein [Pleurocapsa sp. FMAR1]|uniref:enoyl-CoA hydratase/isomerase family protein n=1 Tax=Pleurocapsa sp. FMAR1 TaxID=3040204 RepID=UPI0029C88FD8|nr:enoyl-CoA hydratase/isomerase family protein [Pleurocapsa sp. FMAR1]